MDSKRNPAPPGLESATTFSYMHAVKIHHKNGLFLDLTDPENYSQIDARYLHHHSVHRGFLKAVLRVSDPQKAIALFRTYHKRRFSTKRDEIHRQWKARVPEGVPSAQVLGDVAEKQLSTLREPPAPPYNYVDERRQ